MPALSGDAMPQRMAMTETLTLFAVATTLQALAAPDGQKIGLDVTATVVRPTKVSTIMSGAQVKAVTIADPAYSKVVAEGGTVIQMDQNIRVLPNAGADSLVVTITY